MKSDSILSLLNEQMEILFSWGFNNEVLMENGLQFNVQGFLFNGIVKVIFCEENSSFIIRLENMDGCLQAERTDVPLEELVNTIDGLVEKDCSQKEYEKMVRDAYEKGERGDG